ncbi:MAG: HEAT repeat domain-containing protein [Capsulimonadaceae bacterium]
MPRLILLTLWALMGLPAQSDGDTPFVARVRRDIGQLKSSDVSVRRSATRDLWTGWGGPGTQSDRTSGTSVLAALALVNALSDIDARVRANAAVGLGDIFNDRDNAPPPSIVPALVQALEDPDPEVRIAVATSLGDMWKFAASAVPALVHSLSDERTNSAAALALSRFSSALPALAEAMHNPDRSVRERALTGLDFIVGGTNPKTGSNYPSPAAPILVDALKDSDPIVRAGAAQQLGIIFHNADTDDLPLCAPVVAALAQAVNDTDQDVRLSVVDALGEIGPSAKQAVRAIIPLLHDPDVDVRVHAASTLGNIGALHTLDLQTGELLTVAPVPAKFVVPALVRALDSPGTDLRAMAAKSLGKIGSPAAAAVPALLRALNDTDPGVRSSAAEAVAQIGAPISTLPTFIRLLDDPAVQWSAVDALGSLGPRAAPAVPGLIRVLKVADSQQDIGTARIAAQAIGKIGPRAAPALDILLHVLEDGSLDDADVDRSVTDSAAVAIGRLGAAAAPAIPALVSALRSPDPNVRQNAAYALGCIGARAFHAIPALMRVLKDPTLSHPIIHRQGMGGVEDTDLGVRVSAALALRNIGTPTKAILPVFLDLLRQPSLFAYYVYGDRVRGALGNMGTSAASALPLLAVDRGAGDAASITQICAALVRSASASDHATVNAWLTELVRAQKSLISEKANGGWDAGTCLDVVTSTIRQIKEWR